jgi:hypothetical protein
MKRTLSAIATVLLLLAGAMPTAHAVQCAAGVSRAGCVGPNGAVVAGPNGVHKTAPPPAGTTVKGAKGSTATKALQPGCAYVNGKRVCK